jgi:hypothetical protein
LRWDGSAKASAASKNRSLILSIAKVDHELVDTEVPDQTGDLLVFIVRCPPNGEDRDVGTSIPRLPDCVEGLRVSFVACNPSCEGDCKSSGPEFPACGKHTWRGVDARETRRAEGDLWGRSQLVDHVDVLSPDDSVAEPDDAHVRAIGPAMGAHPRPQTRFCVGRGRGHEIHTVPAKTEEACQLPDMDRVAPFHGQFDIEDKEHDSQSHARGPGETAHRG